MIKLNLLPWRERSRQSRRRVFYALGVSLGLLVVGLWQSYPPGVHAVTPVLRRMPAPTALRPQKIGWRYIGYLQEQARVWAIVQLASGKVVELMVDSEVKNSQVRVVRITPANLTLAYTDGRQEQLPFTTGN